MSSARTVFPRQRERERAIACGAEQPRRTGWPEIVLIVRTGRPSLQSVAGRVYPGVSIRLVPRRANSDFNSIFRSPLAVHPGMQRGCLFLSLETSVIAPLQGRRAKWYPVQWVSACPLGLRTFYTQHMAQYDAPEIEQDTTPTAGVCVSNCSIHLLDYHYLP